MSRDRTNSPESRLAAALRRLTGWSLSQPTAVLAGAAALAVLSAAFTGIRLSADGAREAYLNPHGSAAHDWRELQREFGLGEDVIVAVESLDSATAEAAADELATAVRREDELFHHVYHRLDLSPLKSKALSYVDVKELQAQHRQLGRLAPVFRRDWSALSVERLLPPTLPTNSEAAGAESLAERRRIETSLIAAMSGDGYRSPWLPSPPVMDALKRLDFPVRLAESPGLAPALSRNADAPPTAVAQPVTSSDGIARAFVALRLDAGGGNDGPSFAKQLTVLSTIVDQVASRHPATRIGLTGETVLAQEETSGAILRGVAAGLTALAAAVLVLSALVGSLRHAAAVGATLALVLAGSFGWATLSVGTLHTTTSWFSVIVIALGAAPCVTFVGRYLDERNNESGVSICAALQVAAAEMGPMVLAVAGCCSATLLALAFVDSPGLAQFGVIVGGGLLLSAPAALIVLPVLLLKLERKGAAAPVPLEAQWLNRLVPSPRWAAVALVVSILLTSAAAAGLLRLQTQNDFRATRDLALAGSALDRRLREAVAHPGDFIACSCASRAEALSTKAQLESLPLVSRVEEISTLLPDEANDRQPLIQNIHDRLQSLPNRPPVIPLTEAGRQRAEQTLQLWREGTASGTPTGTSNGLALAIEQRELEASVYAWQQHIVADLLSRLSELKLAANPQPPAAADLPEEIVRRFLGETGSHLLRVYPRHAPSAARDRAAFVAQVREVAPHATGRPVLEMAAAAEARRGVAQAAAFGALALLIVGVLALRSLRDGLLSLLPAVLATIQVLGLLGWCQESLSPVNWPALLVIVASSATCGVMVLHELRRGKSLSPAAWWSALAAIAAAGSLLFHPHPDWQSLGRTLVIGQACAVFSAAFVLPAAAAWLAASDVAEAPVALRIAAVASDEGDFDAADDPFPSAIPIRAAEPRRKAA